MFKSKTESISTIYYHKNILTLATQQNTDKADLCRVICPRDRKGECVESAQQTSTDLLFLRT